MSDFNLRELIESVEDSGPSAADMAAKAWPMIPESERDSVGEFLLTRYIAVMKPRLSMISPQPAPSANRRPAKSAKVAAYQEHARFLRLSVNVARGEDKWMGDCTYADLCYAAENRRHKAAETLAAAEQYETLAALVKRHKVATVAKLPRAVLTEFIATTGQAAA